MDLAEILDLCTYARTFCSSRPDAVAELAEALEAAATARAGLWAAESSQPQQQQQQEQQQQQ